MDAFMGWLMKRLEWLPKLGAGYGWRIGDKVVMLWPFVAMAIALAIIFLFDWVIR